MKKFLSAIIALLISANLLSGSDNTNQKAQRRNSERQDIVDLFI